LRYILSETNVYFTSEKEKKEEELIHATPKFKQLIFSPHFSWPSLFVVACLSWSN